MPSPMPPSVPSPVPSPGPSPMPSPVSSPPSSPASAQSLAASSPVRSPAKESSIQSTVKDVSASHDTGGFGDAERHYISSNCDVKVLLVLCRGIFEPDGSPLLDENAEPWRSVKPRLSIKPTAKDLRAEVTRRFQSFICNGSDKTRAPQPKQWTTDKLEEYLKNHPITKETDVQFLRRKVLEHKLIVEEAQLSSQCNNDLLQKEWYEKIPVL